jgi:sugar phosphate isomerase/epimerase
MIHALGSKLQALHIHDNNRHHDSHEIPFSMDIDFDPIVKALKDIRYSGWFTLEADRYLTAYTAENVLDGVQKMADAAKKLTQMFDR